MREIKFRGWDKELKEMFFVQTMTSTKKDGVVQADYGNHIMNYPNGCDLMQYIGLKDKNGVDMYEGDIVETYWKYDNHIERGFIIFNEKYACFAVQEQHDKRNKRAIGNYQYEGKIEVISNIYEDKNLLI